MENPGRKGMHNYNISRVVRSIRKYHGLNQSQLSEKCRGHVPGTKKEVGIKQSYISKIENKGYVPNLGVWYNFIKHFDLGDGYFEYTTGFTELSNSNRNITLIEKLDNIGNFTIPKRYGHNVGSTVRTVIPFINLAKERLGGGHIDSLIQKKMCMDPDYFTILNAPINLNFAFDLLEYLYDKNLLYHDDFEFKDIAQYSLHGQFSKYYKKATHKIDLFHKLITKIKKYEVNYTYTLHEISKENLTFDFTRNPHCKEFNPRREINQYLWRYKKNYFKIFQELRNFQKDNENINFNYEEDEHSYCLVQATSHIA